MTESDATLNHLVEVFFPRTLLLDNASSTPGASRRRAPVWQRGKFLREMFAYLSNTDSISELAPKLLAGFVDDDDNDFAEGDGAAKAALCTALRFDQSSAHRDEHSVAVRVWTAWYDENSIDRELPAERPGEKAKALPGLRT